MENATVEEQENRMVYAHTKFIWDLLMEENLSGTSFDLRFVQSKLLNVKESSK
jgi:hypothetical protein